MNDIEKIQKIVKLTYLSAFLVDEKPLSLILIAPPEQSKTYHLLQYKTKYSQVSTDLSYIGLIKLLIDDKNIKHIVIPDFLKVTEKGNATKKSIISALNSFLEEGIFKINLGNKEKIDLNGRRGGIITATTTYSLFQNAKNWNGTGFKSRFISVNWSYTPKTLKKIMEKIAKNEEKTTKSTKKRKKTSKKIAIKRGKVNINGYGLKLISYSDYSLRKLENLTVLLKTIALKNEHDTVKENDFQELLELIPLINNRSKEI